MPTEPLITETEVNDLASVIQLSPHQKDTQVVPARLNSEDEPLISLDELYEQTGKEEINKIVQGFERLIKNNKLNPETGRLLKLSGTENWTPGYDRRNAIIGKEGVFSAIKDAIVYVVQAIIKFIKGICNWIVDRFKVLFGLSRSAKETEHLIARTTELKKNTTELLKSVSNEVNFDPIKFYSSLPDGMTDTDHLVFMKSRYQDNKNVIEDMKELVPQIDEIKKKLNSLSNDMGKAKQRYDREINALKKKAGNKNSPLTPADVFSFNAYITQEIWVTLDLGKIYDAVSEISEKILKLNVEGLGISGGVNPEALQKSGIPAGQSEKMASLKEIQNRLSSGLEKIKMNINPLVVSQVQSVRPNIEKTILSLANTQFDNNFIRSLSDFISKDDPEVIRKIVDINEMTIKDPAVAEIGGNYISFSNRMGDYSSAINLLITSFNMIQNNYNGIIRWYYKTEGLICRYISRDVVAIVKYIDENLSEEEKKKLLNEKEIPTHVISMIDDFEAKYPGINLTEEIGNTVNILRKVDEVNKPLSKWLNFFGLK